MGGNNVAWLALVIACIALWLSWSNYNRTNEVRLEDTIKEYAEEKWEQLGHNKEESASSTEKTEETTE